MNRYFKYILLLTGCIFLAGCAKQDEDFAPVTDTDEVQETQAGKEVYWEKQFDVNGTNVSQIIINAKIGEVHTDSLYEVALSRKTLDARYAEETADSLFDSYEKEEVDAEERIGYTGYWDNQLYKLRVYDTGMHFFLANYKDGLYHFPEGEWESASSTQNYITEENNSKISSAEAEQIAGSFLAKMGLDIYHLAKIEDLYWKPEEEAASDDGFTVNVIGGMPSDTWCEGYVLTYARDIKGVCQDVEEYWYTTVESQMRMGHAYNSNLEKIVLYVTDFGVIDAWVSQLCDGEEHALEGQKIVDLEAAQKRFEEILISDPNRFAEGISGNRLEFNALDLVYYADAPNHISPVWRLSRFAEPDWELAPNGMVHQQVILINAVSGKEIDPKTETFYPYIDEIYYEYDAD